MKILDFVSLIEMNQTILTSQNKKRRGVNNNMDESQ